MLVPVSVLVPVLGSVEGLALEVPVLSVVPEVPVSGVITGSVALAGSVVLDGSLVLPLVASVALSPLVAGWQEQSIVVEPLVPVVSVPVPVEPVPVVLLVPLVVGSHEQSIEVEPGVLVLAPEVSAVPAAVLPLVLAPEVVSVLGVALVVSPMLLAAGLLVLAPLVVSVVSAAHTEPPNPSIDTRIAIGSFFMLPPEKLSIGRPRHTPKVVVRQTSTQRFAHSQA